MGLAHTCQWILTNVGSNDTSLRGDFWAELDSAKRECIGPWCIDGDFIVIHSPISGLRPIIICKFDLKTVYNKWIGIFCCISFVTWALTLDGEGG